MPDYAILYRCNPGHGPDFGGAFYTREEAAREREQDPKLTDYTIGTWEEYHAAWLQIPLREITEREWWDALEVLPPMAWHHDRGVERFCICEMTSGPITNQYARIGDRYFTKYVDVTKRDTWIDGARIQVHIANAREAQPQDQELINQLVLVHEMEGMDSVSQHIAHNS